MRIRNKDRFLARHVLAALSLTTTGCGAYVFARMLWADGTSILDGLLLGLFVLLFLWVSTSFWLATMGFLKCVFRPERAAAPFVPQPRERAEYAHLPRTAIVMPIYNESPSSVFAGLRAMFESLRQTGHADRFDFFILSDTNDPEVWLEEELAWAELSTLTRGVCGVFYRRREKNEALKSGNIADFCRRWGAGYPYMIVLDADSLMAGWTLLEMVRRMEADPQIGILQVPPLPVDRGSLFARIQQWSASVYGVIFTTGFALWTQVDGNYYGHNAVIRIRPFMEHCGLPRLPGRPPLGGEILSHDFVEAALMRRAGYEIFIANDLSGSYEECPSTLIDFAKRDQRWCQGNLQHVRLIFAHGLHPVSRLHLSMGAMSYLSSPLWLLFMLLGVLDVFSSGGMLPAAPGPVAAERGLLLAATLVMLFLPKLWGLVLLLRRRLWLSSHGGLLRASLSIVLETLASMLIAPILMAFHATFVFMALGGRSVRWNPQRRDDGGTALRDAVEAHLGHTVAGLAALAVVLWLAPQLTLWSLPIVTGLILSIPLSMAMGSFRVGRSLRRAGLLLIPEEANPPELLLRQRALQAEGFPRHRGRLDRFSEVVLDPVFNEMHLAILRSAGGGRSDRDDLGKLQDVAILRGPGHLRRGDKLALLCDEASLRSLHRRAWAHWPLEVLEAVIGDGQDDTKPAAG